MKANSMFIMLTDANFRQEVLESKQPVLVEFSVDWSGACHINAPITQEMAAKFRTQVKFCKIDVDDYGDVAKQYGMQKIPTMLFFKDGRVVDHIVGLVPKTVITQKLHALLQL